MKSVSIKVMLIGLLLVVSFGCTIFPAATVDTALEPLPEPEGLKLTAMKVPETFQPEIPYEIVVNFESDGEPPIQKVCFQWSREQRAMDRVPAVYCYAMEDQVRMGRERACLRWLAEGEYARISPLYCLAPLSVQYGQPGHFVVRLRTSNVRSFYDRLDGYAEYVYRGKVRWSNQVSSPVNLEPLPFRTEPPYEE